MPRKTYIIKNRLWLCSFILFMALFLSFSAQAACTSPAGVAGEMYYNTSSDEFEYCDDTNWIGMGSPSTPPISGLIGHWKLDETSGSSIADSVGSNTGTWSDGANDDVTEETVAGIHGTALLFDGSDDMINLGSDASLDNVAPLTVCAWVYPVTLPSSGYANIVTKIPNIAVPLGGDTGWDLYTHSSGDVGFSTWNGGFKEPNGLVTGVWQHICATWDGSSGPDGIFTYRNGAYIVSSGGAKSTSTLDDSANNMTIGRLFDGGGGVNFRIDDVRLYDRALTTSEINDIYTATCASPTGSEGEMHYNYTTHVMEFCDGTAWVPMGTEIIGPSTSNLVAHWEFEETSGTTADDSTGNTDNDGVLQGDAAWSTDAAVGSGSILLDGTGDYIRLPDADQTGAVNVESTYSGTSPNQTVTVSVWVKSDISTNSSYDMIFAKLGGVNYLAIENGTNPRLLRSMVRNFGPSANFFPRSNGTVDFFDKWMHVTHVLDDGVGYKFYVNGELERDESDTNVNVGFWGCTEAASHGCNIGAFYWTSTDMFHGRIDDLRVYDGELTESEILYLYGLGASGDCTSPTGVEGEMLYDSTDTSMKYCNGFEWVSIGK